MKRYVSPRQRSFVFRPSIPPNQTNSSASSVQVASSVEAVSSVQVTSSVEAVSSEPSTPRNIEARVMKRSSTRPRNRQEHLEQTIERMAIVECRLILGKKHIAALEKQRAVLQREAAMLESDFDRQRIGTTISRKVLFSYDKHCARCDKAGLDSDAAFCSNDCKKHGPRKRCLNCRGTIDRMGDAFCSCRCRETYRGEESLAVHHVHLTR